VFSVQYDIVSSPYMNIADDSLSLA